MTEILTERLLVRRYRREETELIGRLMRDRRVFFWQTRPVTDRDIDETMEHILDLDPCSFGWFAAFRRGDGDFVGGALLQPLPGTDEIEIGYHLVPQHWGRGYATEAAAAVLDHGFRDMRHERIVAVILPDNERSLRVIGRLGLPYIEERIHTGHRVRFFALSRSDYLAARSAVLDQPEP
jgi:RimJ/RimL family protein N-acetyltransferase